MRETAIVTGAAGQDGSYLCELLLEKGYKVYGTHRRCSTNTLWRIEHLLKNPNLVLLEGDITDSHFVNKMISTVKPSVLFNTAAQSHVHASFEQPEYTFEVNTQGVLHILEAIRSHSPQTRMVHCSTSEMFGNNYSYMPGCSSTTTIPANHYYHSNNLVKCQSYDTPFSPQSPYAVSKVAAHHLVGLYRKAYGLRVSCAISMNHESPRRSVEFVTRKITSWIGEFVSWRNQFFHTTNPIFIPSEHQYEEADYINYGIPEKDKPNFFPKLRLGNIYSFRDWGHARDYCKAFIKITEYPETRDWIIATGRTQSVENFLELAFREAGLEDWNKYVIIDKALFRPAEVDYLCGDPRDANQFLGWKAETNFEELVKEMVNEDINRNKR